MAWPLEEPLPTADGWECIARSWSWKVTDRGCVLAIFLTAVTKYRQQHEEGGLVVGESAVRHGDGLKPTRSSAAAIHLIP